jgi:pyruvate kinase
MAAIAARTERAWFTAELPGPTPLPESPDLDAAVGHAAQLIARSVAARAIIAATTSGSTPRRVACHRPGIPVIALCAREEICRRMALIWGVKPVLVPTPSGTAHLVKLSGEVASKVLKAHGSDVLAIVAGTPYNTPGRTNLIKIEKVSEALRADATSRTQGSVAARRKAHARHAWCRRQKGSAPKSSGLSN